MPKRFRVIPAGTFKGPKITVADTSRVDAHSAIATSFMSEVFDLLPGDYAISDESELRDFTAFDSRETSHEWTRIEELYGFTRQEAGTECLAAIFERIAAKKNTQ